MQDHLNYIGTPNETIEIKKCETNDDYLDICVNYTFKLAHAWWRVKKNQYKLFLETHDKKVIVNYFQREELDRILDIISTFCI